MCLLSWGCTVHALGTVAGTAKQAAGRLTINCTIIVHVGTKEDTKMYRLVQWSAPPICRYLPRPLNPPRTLPPGSSANLKQKGIARMRSHKRLLESSGVATNPWAASWAGETLGRVSNLPWFTTTHGYDRLKRQGSEPATHKRTMTAFFKHSPLRSSPLTASQTLDLVWAGRRRTTDRNKSVTTDSEWISGLNQISWAGAGGRRHYLIRLQKHGRHSRFVQLWLQFLWQESLGDRSWERHRTSHRQTNSGTDRCGETRVVCFKESRWHAEQDFTGRLLKWRM